MGPLLMPKASVIKKKVVTKTLDLSVSYEKQNGWSDKNLPLSVRLPPGRFSPYYKHLHIFHLSDLLSITCIQKSLGS